MIAVVGALELEISAFKDSMKNLKEVTWGSRSIYTGFLFGVECVLTYSGVGKVYAALTVQHVIDVYDPKVIFFVGIAGALDSSLKTGDIIVAKETLQYDFDLTAFGFKPGEIPVPGAASRGEGGRSTIGKFLCTSEYVSAATTLTLQGAKIKTGLVVTGDNFVDFKFLKNHDTTKKFLYSLNAAALDMEGASAAHVCYENNVPFLLCRVISDFPENDDKRIKHFGKFVKKSSRNLFLLVSHTVKKSCLNKTDSHLKNK